MKGGQSRYLPAFGLLMLALTIAIFSLGVQKYDFIRNDDFRQPATTIALLRKLVNQESINASIERSSQARGPATSPCFRQVQLWRGKNHPKKPKEHECPGSECGMRFVDDTSFETMTKSDAVVLFHKSHWDWGEMQKRRPPNQAWVFYSLESPFHHSMNVIIPPKNSHLYNYTMTYRPSSTIYSPYGIYDSKVPQVPPDDDRNWARGKTGMVVWMASNCHVSSWKRHEFVRKLSKFIKVDIYGACGNLHCPRNANGCWDRISTYKFYLALENSECRDYFTEKFWRNALLHDVVPIVYGAPKEDYLQVAPPNSFIHLQDFNSIPELTDYLHLLDSNDTLYNSFFEWKRHGSVRFTGQGVALSPSFLCQVVAKVRTYENEVLNGKQEVEEVIPSIDDWWSHSCKQASGFPHDF